MTKKLPEGYLQLIAQLKDSITPKHFMRVVGDPQKTHRKSTKLKRQDFKAFIALRYGSQIAEKWCNVLDFTL